MMKSRKLIQGCSFVLTVGCFQASLLAATIATNPITGTNPGLSNPYTTGQTVHGNVTFSGIGRVGASYNAANDRYNATNWSIGAIDTTKYFTFTVTPKAGYAVDFMSFVYTGQASGTGPTAFAFRSSQDGFKNNIGTPTASGMTINLSALEAAATAIEFRMYGYSAGQTSGTYSINDFTFSGDVNAAPEPAVLGLAGLSGVALLGRRKRVVVQDMPV